MAIVLALPKSAVGLFKHWLECPKEAEGFQCSKAHAHCNSEELVVLCAGVMT